MKLSDLAQQAAVLKVIADEIAARQQAVKALMEQGFGDTGTTQTVAQLPDGTKVATVSLSGAGSKTAAVTDDQAFLLWVLNNYPDEIIMHVREDSKKKWLDGAKIAGKPVDTRTGEAIPGVTVRDSRPFVSVRFKPGGADAIVTAYRAGELAEVELVAPAAIEAGETA